jgi:serine/threonine protein kinase
VQPGERIGDGADGEVLSITGSPDRVLKLGVIYDSVFRPLSLYHGIERVLNHLMLTPSSVCVHVYEHGYLGVYERQVADPKREQLFILYYYIMEKLEKLSEDEKKIFHSILDHEDRGIAKDYSISKIKKMLKGMSRGLDFDQEKVMLFCDNLRRCPILHLDISARNIMKDATGNYKLVDFDRAALRE